MAIPTKEEEKAELTAALQEVTAEIQEVDERRRQLAARRRRIMWSMLALPSSLAEVAKIAGMHRGAVHKDLSRHQDYDAKETS